MVHVLCTAENPNGDPHPNSGDDSYWCASVGLREDLAGWPAKSPESTCYHKPSDFSHALLPALLAPSRIAQEHHEHLPDVSTSRSWLPKPYEYAMSEAQCDESRQSSRLFFVHREDLQHLAHFVHLCTRHSLLVKQCIVCKACLHAIVPFSGCPASLAGADRWAVVSLQVRGLEAFGLCCCCLWITVHNYFRTVYTHRIYLLSPCPGGKNGAGACAVEGLRETSAHVQKRRQKHCIASRRLFPTFPPKNADAHWRPAFRPPSGRPVPCTPPSPLAAIHLRYDPLAGPR
jgi:hypothetical protein